MPPHPHFEAIPYAEPEPHREGVTANDEHFGELDEAPVTLESLYAKRRAHEKILELGHLKDEDKVKYQSIIAKQQKEIERLGGSDADYETYLKEIREPDPKY